MRLECWYMSLEMPTSVILSKFVMENKTTVQFIGGTPSNLPYCRAFRGFGRVDVRKLILSKKIKLSKGKIIGDRFKGNKFIDVAKQCRLLYKNEVNYLLIQKWITVISFFFFCVTYLILKTKKDEKMRKM